MDEQTGKIIEELVKQTTKEPYNDIGKPVLKPIGETIGLIPRAIKAALLPVEKWVLGREYNLEETKKILEYKLQKLNPDLIETPEPYIAVPTIQYISYCMDSKELRDMYANLLANSMNKMIKGAVHPGFVEIIKQLSPDEAKLLKQICIIGHSIPVINIRYVNSKYEGVTVFYYFSNIGEIAGCENPFDITKYFENLQKLGLIKESDGFSSLVDKTKYEPLKKHNYIKAFENIPEGYAREGYNQVNIEEGYFNMTEFGKEFCNICIDIEE